MPVDLESFAFVAVVVTCGYFVFGLSGFGAALVAVPIISHVWPVQFVLPIFTLLDFVAALSMGTRQRKVADRSELTRMIPLAFLGALLGALVLVNLPRTGAMIGLGMFVMLYGIYALADRGTVRTVDRNWAYVSGAVGGTIGALFGIGGPAYVIYLSRRIHDKNILRATIATMVIFSVVSRLVVFVATGLFTWDEIKVAVVLLPFVFAGLWIGGHVHLRVSREQLGRVINALLIASGISLLARALAS